MKALLIISSILISLTVFAGGGGGPSYYKCLNGHIVELNQLCPGQKVTVYKCPLSLKRIKSVLFSQQNTEDHIKRHVTGSQPMLTTFKKAGLFSKSKTSYIYLNREEISPGIFKLDHSGMETNLQAEILNENTVYISGLAKGIQVNEVSTCDVEVLERPML